MVGGMLCKSDKPSIIIIIIIISLLMVVGGVGGGGGWGYRAAPAQVVCTCAVCIRGGALVSHGVMMAQAVWENLKP